MTLTADRPKNLKHLQLKVGIKSIIMRVYLLVPTYIYYLYFIYRIRNGPSTIILFYIIKLKFSRNNMIAKFFVRVCFQIT